MLRGYLFEGEEGGRAGLGDDGGVAAFANLLANHGFAVYKSPKFGINIVLLLFRAILPKNSNQ